MSEARSARDRLDWEAASAGYAEAVTLQPDNAALRVQYGHVLKDSGRLAEAELAYRTAILSAPGSADARLHLGHVLKMQGRQDQAIDAYAEALGLDATFEPARRELIAAGARHRLPRSLYGRDAASQALERVAAVIDRYSGALSDWSNLSIFPVTAYDEFRRAFPVPSPPPVIATAEASIVIVIDAMMASPSRLRATLQSLVGQTRTDWRALVRAAEALHDHPVASMVQTDPRIEFLGSEAAALDASLTPHPEADVLFVTAGVWLDSVALAWFSFAASRSGAAVVYADHDHYIPDWRRGSSRFGPVLQAMPGVVDLSSNPCLPEVILVTPVLRAAALAEWVGGSRRAARDFLVATARTGRAVHVSHVLSSLPDIPEAGTSVLPDVVTFPFIGYEEARLLVVVPTRDQPTLLEACVRSLIRRASRPNLVKVVVLDHRGRDPETARVLSMLQGEGLIRVIRIDDPFNWSRFNNLAVADQDDDILVFANDDVEMLVDGWDDQLRRTIALPEAGVVGVRLLYPDGTLQHAGIMLGNDSGRPIHEGRGAARDEPGPLDRWCRSREAAAVTGAFMAVRRSVFEDVGGFDEHLSIAYNDVDLCLRIREAGLQVIYLAQIELVHHESKTRGFNTNAEKVAWDDAELAQLYARWKATMELDPSVNPSWTSTGDVAFDGYSLPRADEVLARLEPATRRTPTKV